MPEMSLGAERPGHCGHGLLEPRGSGGVDPNGREARRIALKPEPRLVDVPRARAVRKTPERRSCLGRARRRSHCRPGPSRAPWVSRTENGLPQARPAHPEPHREIPLRRQLISRLEGRPAGSSNLYGRRRCETAWFGRPVLFRQATQALSTCARAPPAACFARCRVLPQAAATIAHAAHHFAR